MEELKFKTKTGYCQILPDKIVLTGETPRQQNQNSGLVIQILFLGLFTVGTISAGLKSYSQENYLGIFLSFVLTALFLFFILLLGHILLNLDGYSNSPEILRDSIQKIKFTKAIPVFTLAYFTVYFNDKKGKKKRLIILPGLLKDGPAETKRALDVMKKANLL